MYLTWGETPRTYGVFGSQVIGQFVETKQKNPNDVYLFVSAVPLIHSGLIREKVGYFDEIEKVKKALNGINFVWIPIFISQNFVNASKKTFNWMFFGAIRRFKYLIEEFEPDIVHCRSYMAAWAALQVRSKYGLDYRIIFDARGLYPEEVALKNGYQENNQDYKFLKEIERVLLEKSDVTIAVSDTMARHFRGLNAKRVETIYLSASSEKLRVYRDNDERVLKPINFCYVGALSEDTWHKISSLFELFSRLKRIFADSTLTIVTTSNHNSIRSAFSTFSSNDITITSSTSLSVLKKYLSAADFGLMPYFSPENSREELLADMVMAVKTAEYICAGLPVIVNKCCGGVAFLVKKYNMGIVYDPKKLSDLNAAEIELLRSSGEFCNEISEKARLLFDYKVHADKYSWLYRDLININSARH